MQDQDLRLGFHWADRIKQPACKIFLVWTKNEETFEKFHENFEIFRSKSLWKLTFFTIFTKYLLGSPSSMKIYTSGRQHQIS